MTLLIKAAWVIFFALGASIVAAEEFEWVDIAKYSNGMRLQAAKGKLAYGKNKKGEPISTMLLRGIKSDESAQVMHWRLKVADCLNGKGVFEIFDPEGTLLKEAAFAKDQSDTASLVASVICAATEMHATAKQKNKHKNLDAIDTQAAMKSGWFEFTPLPNGVETQLNSDSFSRRTTLGGESVLAALIRFTPDKINATQIEQWYVKEKDCASGKGEMVRVDAEGGFLYENPFDTSTAFVFTGSIFDTLAFMLCTFDKEDKEKQKDAREKKTRNDKPNLKIPDMSKSEKNME